MIEHDTVEAAEQYGALTFSIQRQTDVIELAAREEDTDRIKLDDAGIPQQLSQLLMPERA